MIRRALLVVASAVFSFSVLAWADDLDEALKARVPVVELEHGFAHACPVPQGLVTAWHVAKDDEDRLSVIVAGAHEIAAGTARRHRALDAALWPMPEGMAALPIAAAPAKKGDRVRIVGFAPNFEPRVVRTEVEYVVGAHIITKDHADAGSSGSCVVNEAGEVVAINVAGKPKEGASKEGTTGAYGILIAIARFQEDQFRPLPKVEEGVLPPLNLQARR